MDQDKSQSESVETASADAMRTEVVSMNGDGAARDERADAARPKQAGKRKGTGKADGANAEFAKLFTEHLPALAAQDVVFADLQNVFDLGLATALIHAMSLEEKAGWQSEVLAVNGAYAPDKVEVPNELMTAANSRVYRTGEIVVQVAGGVKVDLRGVVKNPENFDVKPEVAQDAAKANPIGQNGQWWWDAAAR